MQQSVALPTTFRLRRWIASTLALLLITFAVSHSHASAVVASCDKAIAVHAADAMPGTDGTDDLAAPHPACHLVCGSAFWLPASPTLATFIASDCGYPHTVPPGLRSVLREQLKRPPRA